MEGIRINSDYLKIAGKQLSLTIEKKSHPYPLRPEEDGCGKCRQQTYINEVYFPEMARAGSKYAAIIIPESIFGQASVNSILGKKNEALFEAKLFKNADSAVGWLSQIG